MQDSEETRATIQNWMPAFAGMTERVVRSSRRIEFFAPKGCRVVATGGGRHGDRNPRTKSSSHALALEGRSSLSVRGVIVALRDDPKLKRALSMVPSVDFFRYTVSFKLMKS